MGQIRVEKVVEKRRLSIFIKETLLLRLGIISILEND
jgi:hypothetical protein